MNSSIQMGITIQFYIDTRGQILISVLFLLISIYLIDAYIRQGKILKQMEREEAEEREREHERIIKKESNNPLRKV